MAGANPNPRADDDGDDEDYYDWATPPEALSGHAAVETEVGAEGDGGLGDRLLELCGAITQVHLLLAESGPEVFGAARGRLALLRALVKGLPAKSGRASTRIPEPRPIGFVVRARKPRPAKPSKKR